MNEAIKISIVLALVVICFSGFLSGTVGYLMSYREEPYEKSPWGHLVASGSCIAAIVLLVLKWGSGTWSTSQDSLLTHVYYGSICFLAGVVYFMMRRFWIEHQRG